MERLEFLVEVVDLIMGALKYVDENLLNYIRRLQQEKLWDFNTPKLYNTLFQTYLDARTA